MCDRCPYSTQLERNLLQHLRRQHDFVDPERRKTKPGRGGVSPDTPGAVKCGLCDYWGRSEATLYQHQYVRHSDAFRARKAAMRSQVAVRELVRCPECGVENRVRPIFDCSVCEHKCDNERSLYQHLRKWHR